MKINCELQAFNIHNEIDKLLRNKDSQVLSEKKLHIESSYTFISFLNLMK